MTRVVMETAALADAIKKADRVAPTTAGQAFDKAAGILLEVNPGTPAPLIIKATNLDLYSMEWMDVIEAEGERSLWRLPSMTLARVVGSLPIGSGKTVVLESIENGHQFQVHLTAGSVKCQFNMMDASYFPSWGAFDPTLLTPVEDLGGRLAQVEWAAAKTEPPFCGVNMDGKSVKATDKYRMVRAPLLIPSLSEPVTIPAGVLAQLLRQTGEINIGFDGNQLLIMPDEHSQYRAILFGMNYPNLDRIMDQEIPASFKVRKTQLLEILNRVGSFDTSRDPVLKVFIGDEQIAMVMVNHEVGGLRDILDISGYAVHEMLEILFTPKNLIEPVNNCPSEELEIFYNPDNSQSPLKIDGGSGYTAWAMPRRKMQASV